MNAPLPSAARTGKIRPEPAEFALIVACVVTRARRRLAWLEEIGEQGGDADSPLAEARWQTDSEAGRGHGHAIAVADAALSELKTRFQDLCRLFALAPAEREILLAASAVRLDPGAMVYFQRLQGRPWATEPLVGRLFGHGRRAIWNPDGNLAAWSLIVQGEAAPAEPPPLTADPVLPFWLQGDPHPAEGLAGHVRPLPPVAPLDDWPVTVTAERLRSHLHRGQPVRLVVEGAPGSGRATFAAAIARMLGLDALAVEDLPPELPWPRAWMLVQRQAMVADALPIWRHPPPAWPHGVPPAMVQAICGEPGTELPEEPRMVDLHVSLPEPGHGARAALLARLLPASAAWSPADRRRLAERPGVTIGDLARLGRHGVASVAEAEAQLRIACAGRLGGLAERLETGFEWDDLVLPAPLLENLRDFAFEARHRTAFWERPEIRRLFPGGRGLVALFAGPPGTGKTMAAQIIAREIGIDVFRIDLATMMSKYIGETAKNLKQLFARAAEMHALLLFDEADALFANRTKVKDAHDRYANIDTNYLLQQLEGFSGLAVLATNRKANIDTAFLRRIRYVFDFPRPDAPERRRLWNRLAPPILGADAARTLTPTLDALGNGLELSGAQIKNALVAGRFAASRRAADPDIRDLIKGIERELAKEGRALSPREQQRLTSHG